MKPDRLDLVIDLQVPTAQVLRRLASRRVCVDCGTNYSTSSPPMLNWTCDVCGGEVIQREDDTEEAIGRRLELYEVQTAPLVEWYQDRKLLVDHQRRRDARRGHPAGHRAIEQRPAAKGAVR